MQWDSPSARRIASTPHMVAGARASGDGCGGGGRRRGAALKYEGLLSR